jgi:hypothetical protein
MAMDVSVELHCDRCGSANLTLPAPSDGGGTILCNDCGADHGTLDQLRAELEARALEQSAQALRRDLDKLP